MDMIITQLGGSLREIRDTWGVTKEEVAGIVPESWSEWGLGAEGDAASRPPEVDMLVAHDALTTNSRKALHKLGKLVNQARHAVHTALFDLLPETARPPRPDDPLGGGETKTLAKARYRILQGAGATAWSYPQQSSWALEGVSWGLRNMWQGGAPAAMQPMRTPDTHVSVPEPARR